MQLTKDIIGKKLKSYTIQVEKGKIREFCMAIGEKNPVFYSEEEAKKAGYDGIPIPPTFQTTFQFWGYPEIFEDMRKLGIDTDRLLHMKEEYTYQKPVYAGMTIRAESEVVDVKIGKMEVVTFRTTYKNEKDEICIIAEMGIILRPKES